MISEDYGAPNPQIARLMAQERTQMELDDLLAESLKGTKHFCKAFLPNLFYRPFAKLHDAIFEILDDDTIQRFAIAAPRDIGKTSIVNIAFPLRRILFMMSHYIIPISCTERVAVEHGENLKSAMMTNENVLSVPEWSDLRPTERRLPFGSKEWVLTTGAKIKPRGAGQQVRGGLYEGKRPDLYVCDDLEDPEKVMSEDQRVKLYDWFFSSVMNSVDIGGTDWRVCFIGTVLHEDSLLNNLLKDAEWITIRLELCDDQYVSNWPEFLSTEKIQEKAKGFRDRGKLGIFYREFRNLVVAKEDQGFKEEYFQEYNNRFTEAQLNADPNIESMVLFDPARTHTEGSANTAIVGVSVNTVSNELFVRDVVVAKMFPDELYEAVFQMASDINAIVIGPEVTGLNEYLLYPFITMMTMKGLFYVIIEVKPREGKTGPRRSGGLVPMYRKKLVWHNSKVCGSLERRLLSWPRCDKWDEIDALSSCIFVLEEGERYFTPKDAHDPRAVEAEYEELTSDPAMPAMVEIPYE